MIKILVFLLLSIFSLFKVNTFIIDSSSNIGILASDIKFNFINPKGENFVLVVMNAKEGKIIKSINL
jgi:hypothetical protein